MIVYLVLLAAIAGQGSDRGLEPHPERMLLAAASRYSISNGS